MKNPRTPGAGVAGAGSSSLASEQAQSISHSGFPCNQYRTRDAATLDRLADVELSHGHHAAAERLAWRAAELRAGGVG